MKKHNMLQQYHEIHWNTLIEYFFFKSISWFEGCNKSHLKTMNRHILLHDYCILNDLDGGSAGVQRLVFFLFFFQRPVGSHLVSNKLVTCSFFLRGKREDLHGSFEADHTARKLEGGRCGEEDGFTDPGFRGCRHCNLDLETSIVGIFQQK